MLCVKNTHAVVRLRLGVHNAASSKRLGSLRCACTDLPRSPVSDILLTPKSPTFRRPASTPQCHPPASSPARVTRHPPPAHLSPTSCSRQSRRPSGGPPTSQTRWRAGGRARRFEGGGLSGQRPSRLAQRVALQGSCCKVSRSNTLGEHTRNQRSSAQPHATCVDRSLTKFDRSLTGNSL